MDYSLLVGIHVIDKNTISPNNNICDDGRNGILSADGKELFYMGIIDYLVPFGKRKKIENQVKSLIIAKDKISVQPPDFYGRRFYEFLNRIIKSP